MAEKHTVEFEATKTINVPTEVEFETKTGEHIDFVAKKRAKVPVRVKFKAKYSKK